MTQDDGHGPRSGKAAFLRRLLEEERKAHDLLDLATDASLLGWGMWDLETGQTEWDERERRIMCFEEDDREAQSAEAWMERIHPEDRTHLERHIEECSIGTRRATHFGAEASATWPNAPRRTGAPARWSRCRARVRA